MQRIKKPIFFILLISLSFLILPERADAFVFDLGNKQLNAIAEATGPFMAAYILCFFIFMLGLALLHISTAILSQIIIHTPELLTVNSETMSGVLVREGWKFTAGIANLLLVLAFIVIAFSIILGIEKIQFKKSLPKLIIVALLINFTLVFVGMGIDVSNILFNSIASEFNQEDGRNVLIMGLEPLFDVANAIYNGVIGGLIGTVSALLVPCFGIVVQTLWIIGFVAFLLPTMVQTLVYGIIMLGLSSLFFLYFAVFIARIFVVQMLAIAAPLAFFCLIFPQTEKWWRKWLNALLQWLFVGVVFVFLMYLAILFSPLIGSVLKDIGTSISAGFLGWFTSNVLNHIVLLLYFGIVFFVGKSFVPAAVNAGLAQLSGMMKAASPYISTIAKGGSRYYRNMGIRAESEGNKWDERAQKAKKGSVSRGFSRAMKGMNRGTSWAVRSGHFLAGTNEQAEREKDINSQADLFKEKGVNMEGLKDIKKRSPFLEKTNPIAAMALAQAGAQLGGDEGLNMFNSKEQRALITAGLNDKRWLSNVLKYSPEFIDDDNLGKPIQTALVGEENPGAARRYLAKKLKASDVESISDKKLMDPDFQKFLIEHKPLSFMLNVADSTKGLGPITSMDQKMSEMIQKLENLKDLGRSPIGPELIRQIAKTPIGMATFGKTHEAYTELAKKDSAQKKILDHKGEPMK